MGIDLNEYELVEDSLSSSQKPIKYIKVGDCWHCVSHRHRAGYPKVTRRGKDMNMNRYVYELKTGERLLDSLVVMHKCDNPSCINPDHLEAGTQKQNMQDKMSKGRGYIPWRGPTS